MRFRLLDAIAERMRGRLTVLVTHSRDEAERLGLRVVQMPERDETREEA